MRFVLRHTHPYYLVNKLESFCIYWTKWTYCFTDLFMRVLYVGVHHWTSEGSQEGWGHSQRPNAGVLEMHPYVTQVSTALSFEHKSGIYKKCKRYRDSCGSLDYPWHESLKQIREVNFTAVSVLHAHRIGNTVKQLSFWTILINALGSWSFFRFHS